MMRDRKISLETSAYALILCLGFALRLAGLGHHPLNDLEAGNALGALVLVNGSAASLPGEPGYLALTTAVFFVFRATEFFARFWPAIFGTLVVLIPLFFTKQLGKGGALLLAVFLAFDPLLVAASRSANGAMLAGLGLLAALGFWQKRKPVWSGISMAVMLSGGPDLWPGLAAFLLAILFSRVPQTILEPDFIENKKFFYLKVFLAALAVLILPGTLFFSRPQLLTTLGTSLVGYFSSWTILGELTFYQAGLAWLLSVTPGVIFAIWSLVSGNKNNDILSKFLGYWFAFALLITIINPSRAAVQLWWVSIPMWTLAARQVHSLLTTTYVENRIVFLIQSALTVALVIFSFLFFSNLVNVNPIDPNNLRNSILGTLLPLLLLLVVTLLLGKGWSPSAARYGLLTGLSLMMFVGMFGSAWKAAGLGNRFENEVWSGAAQPIGNRLLQESLSDLSKWSTGWKNEVDLLVSGVNSPSLKWALRDFEKTDYEEVYNANTFPSVILTGGNSEVKSLASYRGQRIVWSIRPDYLSMTLKDWMKWAIFRYSPSSSSEILLWARNDLFPGSN